MSPSRHKPRLAANAEHPRNLGLPRCNTTVWARVARMHALLSNGHPFTAVTLAAEFETDERTIKRSIAFLRDSLMAPVEFDRKTGSYRYTRPWAYLPMIRVTPDEAAVLKLVRRFIPDSAEGRMGLALRSLLKKFALVVGGDSSFDAQTLENVVLRDALLGAAEQQHLPVIERAVERRQELRLAYQKVGADEAETHIVQPHALRFIRRQWILLTHDLSRDGVLRTFVLQRIHDATPTGKSFERAREFEPEKILEGNFGAYTGRESHVVRIALRDAAAIDALEYPWHSSQQHLKRPDGTLEITMRLNNLVDVKHEILRWGEFAQALEPRALRAAVLNSLKAAAERYGERLAT